MRRAITDSMDTTKQNHVRVSIKGLALSLVITARAMIVSQGGVASQIVVEPSL